MPHDAWVTGFLASEHERVDELIMDLANAIRAGALEEARAAFFKQTRALFRHIDAEERALFPVLEGSNGSRAGVTAIMRLEHVQIRSRVTAVGKALANGDLALAWDGLVELVAFLELHNEKEERVVCPAVDEALREPSLRVALVGRMNLLSRDPSSA